MQTADVINGLHFYLELAFLYIEDEDWNAVDETLDDAMFLWDSARARDALDKRARASYFLTHVQAPGESSIMKLLLCGDDKAYVHLLKTDRSSFDLLLERCDQDWAAWRDGFNNATRMERRDGRPHMLNARLTMALAMVWSTTEGTQTSLELMFGIAGAATSTTL